MNKTVRNIIIGALAGIAAIIVIYATYYMTVMRSDDNAMADLINEGNECMSLSDYYGAIEKYKLALDYEPENRELRDAIAHAYVMYAGLLGTSPEAIAAYQEALLFNDKNTNAYWGIVNIYDENGDEDNVLLTLQTGYLNTNDENMKIKADNIEIVRERIRAEEEARAREEAERLALEESHNDLLSRLIVLFQADKPNVDEIKEMIRGEDFVQMVDEIIGKNNSFYYGDRDVSGLRSGKGIAVYENGYYYYGDFRDDVRSGTGFYIRAVYTESSSIGSYVYEGQWENDKPNGAGVATSNYYADKISSQGLVKQIIKGNFKDGLEDGKMTLTGTAKGGGTIEYVYNVSGGVAEKSSNEDSGIKGQYIIAKSKDEKSNLTSDGSKRGVEGFID